MGMKKMVAAASPAAYVAGLSGWQKRTVTALRKTVRESKALDEVIKWGNLVYLSNGPVLVIRAEESRVLLGFWRGKQMREIEPRLKPGGKYDMANVVLREGDTIAATVVRRLTSQAIRLNREAGDPTHV